MNKRNEKLRTLLETLVGIVAFVLLAAASSFYFKRFDLTEEQRHTLTPTSIQLLDSLQDVVYIKVFLEGDFPADYQRLSQAVEEKLDEMRAYAGEKLQYEFINPSEAPDRQTREKMYGELVQKGLLYSALQIRTQDGVSEKIVFPGALISYRDREIPLQILQNQQRVTDAEMVNRTINNLEYALVNAIYQVKRERQPSIAFSSGHGELTAMQTKDLRQELSKFYQIDQVPLRGEVNSLSRNTGGSGTRVNSYDALVIAKPTQTFNERDKYIIDQFIMNGGAVLWLLDAMNASMDSLQGREAHMSVPLNTGLDDLLFTYGLRINKNLLLDRTCAPIELETGPRGNERLELFPWYFFPVLIPQSGHPIVANLDPIRTNFISSIDTIAVPGITKRILLRTSPYTRVLNSPVRVSLNLVGIELDFSDLSSPAQPVAVLMEGSFTSAYRNRLPPEFLQAPLLQFQERSPSTRQLVISDGDVARNSVSPDSTRFRPLGYEQAAGQRIYGNRELLVNALNYLLGDRSLIEVRSRTVVLRKLDQERIADERQRWQLLNMALPIAITIFAGLIQYFWRRRRYAF